MIRFAMVLAALGASLGTTRAAPEGVPSGPETETRPGSIMDALIPSDSTSPLYLASIPALAALERGELAALESVFERFPNGKLVVATQAMSEIAKENLMSPAVVDILASHPAESEDASRRVLGVYLSIFDPDMEGDEGERSPCPCSDGSFCNYDDGDTGFCESCSKYVREAECSMDGLPTAGAEDCLAKCFDSSMGRVLADHDMANTTSTNSTFAALLEDGVISEFYPINNFPPMDEFKLLDENYVAGYFAGPMGGFAMGTAESDNITVHPVTKMTFFDDGVLLELAEHPSLDDGRVLPSSTGFSFVSRLGSDTTFASFLVQEESSWIDSLTRVWPQLDDSMDAPSESGPAGYTLLVGSDTDLESETGRSASEWISLLTGDSKRGERQALLQKLLLVGVYGHVTLTEMAAESIDQIPTNLAGDQVIGSIDASVLRLSLQGRSVTLPPTEDASGAAGPSSVASSEGMAILTGGWLALPSNPGDPTPSPSPAPSPIVPKGDDEPCDPNPCDNDGSCTAEGTSATCACASGYRGTYCQVVDTGDDSCASAPCAEGATCFAEASNGQSYLCLCGASQARTSDGTCASVDASTATCDDDRTNGDETGTDCGGPVCTARCTQGDACETTGDCLNGLVCMPSSSSSAGGFCKPEVVEKGLYVNMNNVQLRGLSKDAFISGGLDQVFLSAMQEGDPEATFVLENVRDAASNARRRLQQSSAGVLMDVTAFYNESTMNSAGAAVTKQARLAAFVAGSDTSQPSLLRSLETQAPSLAGVVQVDVSSASVTATSVTEAIDNRASAIAPSASPSPSPAMSPSPSPSGTAADEDDSSTDSTGALIGGAVGGAAAAIVLFAAIYCCCCRSKSEKDDSKSKTGAPSTFYGTNPIRD